MNRRECLAASTLGALGLSAFSPRPARASDATSSSLPPVRSCILVFFYGGPSHLDTLDPKPDAPAEVRGEYGTIETRVPGIRICEHLPRIAGVMDRLALVRSMHHPMRNHNSAAAETLTGRTPAGGDQELLVDEARSYPTLGSAVSYGLGPRAHVLPYVALPYTMQNVVQLPGQVPGLLGPAFDRFQVEGDPSAQGFRMASLDPPSDRPPSIVRDRAGLLSAIDRRTAEGPAARLALQQERAIEILDSQAVRRGFDLSREDDAVRDRYGRHVLGQSVLLARRLVESGVNFVSVFNGYANGQDVNWDSHVNLFKRHLELIPPADQAFSALIEDLEARGLLDSTLVIGMAEFGRTPRINGSAGRDHWPDCYTITLAGGGIRGGTVHGQSDKIGAYPDRDPVTPADLAATVFCRFGIDCRAEVHDQTGRPFRLADGHPLASLFA
jgi:hypothetical protein